MYIQRYKHMTRRALLASAGGGAAVAALFPFVPRLEAAEGDASDVCRHVYWYDLTPAKKDLVEENYPEPLGGNTTRRPLEFRNRFTSLNEPEINSKLTFLRDIRRTSAQTDGKGPHPKAASGISGYMSIPDGLQLPASATSVDQYLAQQLEGVTPLRDLRLGVKNGGDRITDISLSFVGGVPQQRYQNAQRVYEDIFAGLGASPEELAAARERFRRQQSVLDRLDGSVDRLKLKVSNLDQFRIDAHHESIRETERKLQALLDFQSEGGCEAPAAPEVPEGEGNDPWRLDLLFPAYVELIAIALACDVTRVAGVQAGRATQNLGYSHLASHDGGGFHAATHGKHSGNGYLRDVYEFRAQTFAGLLTALNNVVEPDGSTLLDNSLVFWTGDMHYNHSRVGDMLCMLAGATGSLQTGGEMVKVDTATHNDVLTTITHFMGFPVDSFGPEEFGTGPLPTDIFSF